MKKIQVTIKGITPLLMNRYSVEAYMEQQKGRRVSKTYDPKEEAEKSAYWSSGKKKELIIPATVMLASMLNGASWHKINKRSAKSVLAGSVRIEPEEISLGTDKYDIDTRAVVIQKARVPKSRATLKNWEASFTIVYNDKLIADTSIIEAVLEEAGQRIGICDFRPSKGGSFGCFEIKKFEAD